MIWGSPGSNLGVIIPKHGSKIGPVLEIGGEPGGDRRVVHSVVKRLRLDGLHPELLRLLLRETARCESRSRRLRFRSGLGRLRGLGVGVNVVRFGGPPEEGAPPLGSLASRVGLPVSGGAWRGQGGPEMDEIGGHFERERERRRKEKRYFGYRVFASLQFANLKGKSAKTDKNRHVFVH